MAMGRNEFQCNQLLMTHKLEKLKDIFPFFSPQVGIKDKMQFKTVGSLL